MEESETVPGKEKWKGRLALVFLFLFAMLWSLGPFFFWSLLGLSAYFGFLSLISSGKINSFFTSFTTQTRQQVQNPYQSNRPRPEATETKDLPGTIRKFIRIALIVLISLFVFSILVGIFAGEVEEGNAAETVELTDTPISDDGSSFWNDKGNAALERPNYDSAVFYYDKALAIDPENTYALYNKGLAYTLQQDYRQANSWARKCVRFHSDYYPAWWLLGYNYDLMNNADSALYFLEKAYVNDYSQPDFLQLMAEVYVKKDRRSNALEVYKKLVTMDTTKAEVYRKMAELDPANADVYRKQAKTREQSPK